jgi:phage I-like protein
VKGPAPVLCSAIDLPDAGVPDWLHLLPAGLIRTVDGRGPFRVADAGALIKASMAAGKLAVDECHSIDHAQVRGGSAPARGWITEMEARADGIWGRVDWSGVGRRIMEEREYRGTSPVIFADKGGTILSIARASLTNTPNLRGLATLHSEEPSMDFRAWLIEALGLAADADDAAIQAAVNGKLSGGDKSLQSQVSAIAVAAGLAADAAPAAVLLGVQQLAAGPDADVVKSLQSELATTAIKLQTMEQAGLRRDATQFVDAAIAEGRVGVKPMRDRYISMHMANPAGTEELVGALPAIGAGAVLPTAPGARDDAGLTEEDRRTATLLSIDPAEFAKDRAAEKEAL